ncbi:HD domain-containing phosphohydrolase [Vibrio azureus]|nr:HD domain-containing phosphohydrolase [Vibrio azureus]
MIRSLLQIIMVVCFLMGSSAKAVPPDWDLKRVLVIHSYDPSYPWTNDIQQGIELGLSQPNSEILYSIEYLDAKRTYTDDYLAKMAKYLKYKYDGYHFDGIILSDDTALHFFNRFVLNQHPLSTPIVAVGINDAKATLEGIDRNGVIFYERDRIKENLQLIGQLRPEMRRLYYLADHSVTSQLIYDRVKQEMSKYPNIELVPIREGSLKETAQKLAKISAKDAVLLTHFNTEREEGIYHSYHEVGHVIGKNSHAPVFVLWNMYLQEPGIVGGLVNLPKEFGFEAGSMLATMLGLSETPHADNNKSTNNKEEVQLDYAALQKYNIDLNDVPESARILNLPPPIIQISPITITIIILLCLIVLSQFIALRQRKVIDNKNRRIVALQGRTLNVQKEMIHVLGEAIECRSGETGQHVKRVAKISVKLAQLFGLSHREIELIEVVSPMHDVGKIAVPEAILDKPGPLNEQEWEIMKSHTVKGYELLSGHDSELIQLAATVAHQHHERWDGDGYPNGLKGEEIHIFARIVAIADVFDALLSKRSYKASWSMEDVSSIFKDKKGTHFDPVLCQLMLDNLHDFIEERALYPDEIN